jgi:ABC-type multidrug transport system fused ATPase/permease subunit
MVQRLRLNVFNAILKQDISFFDENRTGELTNRLSSDTQVVQDCLTENISSFIQNLIHIIGSLIVMFYLNYKLTLILIVLVPIIGLITIKYGNLIENLRKIFQDKLAESANIADESISNIRQLYIILII